MGAHECPTTVFPWWLSWWHFQQPFATVTERRHFFSNPPPHLSRQLVQQVMWESWEQLSWREGGWNLKSRSCWLLDLADGPWPFWPPGLSLSFIPDDILPIFGCPPLVFVWGTSLNVPLCTECCCEAVDSTTLLGRTYWVRFYFRAPHRTHTGHGCAWTHVYTSKCHTSKTASVSSCHTSTALCGIWSVEVDRPSSS